MRLRSLTDTGALCGHRQSCYGGKKKSSAVGDVLRDGPEIASLHWRGNTGGRRLFAGRYRPTAIKPLESIQNMTAQASSVASRPSMSR